MSNDFLLKGSDLKWDDGMVDTTPPPEGRKHFGHLRMYPCAVTKHWEAGKYFTIPGVVGGSFNDKDAAGNMMLKSYTQGGPDRLYIFVATKQDQNGQDYQIVKTFPGKRYRKSDRLDFADVVMPSINKTFSVAQKGQLVDTGLYCEWDDVPTGDKFTPSDGGDEKEVMTWGNFKPYASKDEMKKAEAEFFSQFSGGNNGTQPKDTDYSAYPVGWGDQVEACLTSGAQAFSNGGKPIDVAATLMLFVDDDPVNSQGGQPVDAKAILKECVDKADLADPFKAELHKQIDAL